MTDLVSVPGAATVLGLAPEAVTKLVKDGELPPEATAQTYPIWRPETLTRWEKTGQKDRLPMSPSLEVFTVAQTAERLGVSVAAVRKWRRNGRLTPTWEVPTVDQGPHLGNGPGLLLFAPDYVYALLPVCDGCGSPVDVKKSRPKGRGLELRCSCGTGGWQPLVIGAPA